MSSLAGSHKWIEKNGFVAEYTLILQKKDPKNDDFYFEVTITEGEGPDSGINPGTFRLHRHNQQGATLLYPEERKMVEMAMIATLKEAYLNGKRVMVNGRELGDGPAKYVHLTSVTIKERTGEYLRTTTRNRVRTR